jgi:hypothetical protein
MELKSQLYVFKAKPQSLFVVDNFFVDEVAVERGPF